MLHLTLFRRTCGLIALPLLYIRYSFALFFPMLFIDGVTGNEVFIIWSIYVLVFVFIMGNCEVMHHWTKLFAWIFNVKYDILGKWTHGMVHSNSVWAHPILKVRDKEYKLTIAVMGGNIYNEYDILRRKAIVFWLLF